MRKRQPLHVITGTMFSGKTDELCHKLRRLETYGHKKILIFKPATDTRSPNGFVKSADGTEMPAREIPADRPEAIIELLMAEKAKGSDPEVIGIDETQFFKKDSRFVDIVVFLCANGYEVYAAGLDLDFRGEPFGPVPELLAHADRIEKLEAYCARCGDPARVPQRLVNGSPAPWDSPLIVVGGKESYEARCYNCHEVPGKPALFETTIKPVPPPAV